MVVNVAVMCTAGAADSGWLAFGPPTPRAMLVSLHFPLLGALGLTGAKLVTSDARTGFAREPQQPFPGHVLGNAAERAIPLTWWVRLLKGSWPWGKTLLHSVPDQPDADAARALFDGVLDALEREVPKPSVCLEQDGTHLFAFTVFLKELPARFGPTTPTNG
jgi:transposase-like protein